MNYIDKALQNPTERTFINACETWLNKTTGCQRSFLTTSCSQALHMAAMAIGVESGDEVIMPAWTFPSTANAFVLCGATPVFVDIEPNTLNLNTTLIEQHITNKTKAICITHYAGISANMDVVKAIASQHDLYLIEDAAQCLLSYWDNQHLGTFGDIGTLSFHSTKNVGCGEGGVILVNNPKLIDKVELLREKGTDKLAFLRNEIDHYTWQAISPGGCLSEILAAVLLQQFEQARETTETILRNWNRLDTSLGKLTGYRAPLPADKSQHNGHFFYLINETETPRDKIIQLLQQVGINASSHYRSLHLNTPIQTHQKANLPETITAQEQIIRVDTHTSCDKAEKISEILSAVAQEYGKDNA